VSRSDRIMVAAVGCALIMALAAVSLILAPVEDDASALTSGLTTESPIGTIAPGTLTPASGTIVVDVQGAVLEPGVRELPAGSRVADAIAAAGGYATDADLEASVEAVNLAQPLADGEQIRIPRIGDAYQAAGGGSGPASATTPAGGAGGLVDLNSATPEQLEALPGIGPVTVQKIVAARQEQPFASLEDAVQRGVINRGQLEDIQAVATAG
jgi:competence protein ComEA